MIRYERAISLRRRRLERGGKVSLCMDHSLVGGCPSRLHLNESFESGLKYSPAPSPLPLLVHPQPRQHKRVSPGHFSNGTFLELKPHIQRPRVHLALGTKPTPRPHYIMFLTNLLIVNKASFGLWREMIKKEWEGPIGMTLSSKSKQSKANCEHWEHSCYLTW